MIGICWEQERFGGTGSGRRVGDDSENHQNIL